MAVGVKNQSQNYIYSGGHRKFTALDAPGIILTQLSANNFSHIETHGSTVDLVVIKDGKKQRMRFTADTFYHFMIVLKDESILDPNELDEHITLEEYTF